MLRNALIVSALALFSGFVLAQSTTSKYIDRAILQHGDSVVTLIADAPLPLFQAISAVREEYGWQIDWEEAPGYSRFDVVDDTARGWRSSHPDEKGVTRPAGGAFTSRFPEVKDALDVTIERDVLAKLLQEYNATGNPGKYVLRMGQGGQFAIVGTEVRDETGALQEVPPLLDTPVSIEKEPRNLYKTVRAILNALSSTTGKRVIMMSVPNNEFRTTQVTLGSDKVPARQLLERALASTYRPMQYDLGYDPDVPVYILSVSVAATARDDERGGKILVPVDHPHSVTYLVKMSEEQADTVRNELGTKVCMLVFADGRVQLERRKQQLPNTTPSFRIFESLLDSLQLQKLQNILDREIIKDLPRYMNAMALPRIQGFSAQIARGGGKVQSVGYWEWRGRTPAVSPNAALDSIKKEWQDSETALRPLIEWFHGVEAMKLDESPVKSTLCGATDDAEIPGSKP